MEKIKLDLHEISIPEKDWNQFKKSAEEDDLLILGVGVKYKLAKSRILSLICALGLIAAFVAGAIILATSYIFTDAFITFFVIYIIFAFLCTKKIRRESTLSQITKNLNADYRKILNKLFVPSTFIWVLDFISYLIILVLTIPYQIIMFVIGLFCPKFVISKNGVLVAIPKGYGLDQLEVIGNYYEGISLFNEYMKVVHNETHKYEIEIINEMGCRQVLHSSDNVHFYTDGGAEYISNDGGKTVFPTH